MKIIDATAAAPPRPAAHWLINRKAHRAARARAG